MKDSWKLVRKAILDDVAPIFRETNDPKFSNVELAVDLFKNVLYFKSGIKAFDGMAASTIEVFGDLYSKGNGLHLKALFSALEIYLKKVLYIVEGTDFSSEKSKNLASCLKGLNLLKRDNDGNTPNLEISLCKNYENSANFLKYVCLAYCKRNDEIHGFQHLSKKEVYTVLESIVVVYIYAMFEHLEKIKSVVGRVVTIDAELENYRAYIKNQLSTNLSLRMLESDFGIHIQELDEFEVTLKARAKRRLEEKEEYLKDSMKQRNFPVKFLPEIDGVMGNNKYILLHGIATSGKTTVLKKLGKDFLERYDSPFLFYLELSEIFKKGNGHSISDHIHELFKGFSQLPVELDKIPGKALILLDGLDEVPILESRDSIMEQILALKQYGNLQVVLSSRTNEYLTNNSKIDTFFEKFELLPISITDIAKIGERILGHGAQYSNFVKMIKKSSLLKAFPKTPLTSILLAILFKESDINLRELPKNITELYKKFVDLFLSRWDKSKGISEQFEIQKKEFVLQTIALHMQKSRLISISEEELERFLDELGKRKQIGGPKDPGEHLKNICERTSLLVKDDLHKTYRFFHLTIQEYLAALKFDHKDDDLLVKNFLDEWWLNPNIFYAGNKTDYSEVLTRVSKFETLPVNAESKFNYISHSSQVLLAAHNIDNEIRRGVLFSMLSVFEDFTKEVIQEIIDVGNDKNENRQILRLRNQTLLDIILTLRDTFMEFFQIGDFISELENIWNEILFGEGEYHFSDTTLYALSYCLAVQKKDARFLEEFVITDRIEINSRWFRIVEVDIEVKKLVFTRKKVKLRIKHVANRNHEYIKKQFTERFRKHYESLIGWH